MIYTYIYFREGNAVHTVHLWQPSGNRPNKPKMPGEKKRKNIGSKKRDQTMNSNQKRITRRKKNDESESLKTAPLPTNVIPEQPGLSFHNPGTSKCHCKGITNIYNIINLFGKKLILCLKPLSSGELCFRP